jgi:hypothetical protein
MKYNINRPQWYAKAKFIRQRKNHSWTSHELKRVRNLRIQRVPIDLIIEKLHLDVKRTQIYNVIRMMKKNYNGLCFQCGAALTRKELIAQDGKSFKACTECQEKNLHYKKKIRKSLSRKGLCTCCGNHPPLKGRKTCMHCLSYTHRSRIAKGLCGACGLEPLSPRSRALGKKCLRANRLNTRAYRKEHIHANS